MDTNSIRRVTIESRSVGANETIQALGNISKSQGAIAVSADNANLALQRQQRAMALAALQSQQFDATLRALAQSSGAMVAANDNTSKSGSHVADVLRVATKAAVDHAAAWAATAGAVGAGVLIFGSLLAILGPIILAYKALKEVISLVSEAWELGGKKLEEYRKIAEDAAKVDLSTTYFQRLTKGAEDAKIPVDTLTQALISLQKQSADQLGGSALQNRLDASVKAGNFANNPGVAQFAAANTLEEKFKAIVALVHQAMEDGQRLAALDIANTAFGPAVTDALRKNSEYLDQISASAAKVAETRLVSPDDVGRALELQRRYDAAVAILEQRWHPIQDLLTAAGVKMHEAWVGIVESIAAAVDWATRLVMKIGDIPQAFWDYLKKGAVAAAPTIGAVVAGPVGAAAGAAFNVGVNTGLIGGSSSPAAEVSNYEKGVALLRPQLQNLYEIQRKVNEANTIAQKVYGDTSKTLGDDAEAAGKTRDQYDRAREAVEKHTARMIADQGAIGLGIGAHEEFRAKAQLTTAALQAGLPVTAALTAEIDRLSKAAGAAGQNLAVAAAANKAGFDLATVGLTGVEKSIAQVNFQLYGNKWKDYADSATANTMRITAAIQETRDAGLEFSKSFVQGLMQGKGGMEALTAAAGQLASKMADKALTDLFSGNFLQAGVEGVIAAGAAIFAGDQKAKKELQDAQASWAKMAGQVQQFNAAAAGFDLGPLTNELNSLLSTANDLIAAATKAKDLGSAAKLTDNFYAATTRIYLEFQRGSDVLSPLQQSMKDLNDEAEGLRQSFSDIGLNDFAANIDGIVKDRMAKLLESFNATFVAGLTARLNSAQGKGYLNDAANLLAQRQKDIADAATLGNSPTLLAEISSVFHAEAQKIVDDAGLVGDAFTDFTKQFPALADVVVQANADMAASAKQLQDAANTTAKSITDYVNGLYAGSSSTLSPQAQLAAAQAAYNTKLILAQGGNADAQSSITTSAQSLLDAARAVYASSTTYQSYFQAITSQLLNLPAVQNTTDPVVAAMRDVLTAVNTGNLIQSAQILPAVNAGNATSVANALAAYFNQIDPSGRLASIVTGTSTTAAQTVQIANLQATENSLTTTAVSLANTQNSLLTSINSLQSTAATQLSLLQANLAPVAVLGQGIPSLTRVGSFSQTITIQNGMLQALNKIVFNTYAIAWMIGHPSPNGKNLDAGIDPVYAQGGWITGGVPGQDSVRLASGGLGMPGEFVVRNAVAQANAAWLPTFNRTGRMPTNDNSSSVVQRLDRLTAVVNSLLSQIAQLTYEAGEKGAQATRESSKTIASEIGFRKRAQR